MRTKTTVKAGVSGASAGTTANDYAAGLLLDALGYLSKRIAIKNTGATNTLKFKIISHYSVSGVDVTEKSEATLGPGASWASTTELEHACNDIEVDVASNSAGNHTTYSIEYAMLAPGK